MKVLGVSPDLIISSAGLVIDGEVVAAGAEERFTRQKRTRAFPIRAMTYCLDYAGLSLQDIDAVAMAWNPGRYFEKYNPVFSGHRRERGEYLYSVPDNLLRLLPERSVGTIQQEITVNDEPVRVVYVEHHLAHAALSYFLSGWDEAAILTADGMGEVDTCGFYAGRGNRIEPLQTIQYPHSLGLFYAAFTEYLGFKPDSDEWKVMALSSYAPYENRWTPMVQELVHLRDDGTFDLDLRYFNYYNPRSGQMFSKRFVDRFGPPRNPSEPITERHYQIAAAMQAVTERTLSHMLAHLYQMTGLDRLCVSGGLFMNCVYNAKISQQTPFRSVFVSSAPDDSGTSIGAALWTAYHLLGETNRTEQVHNFYGPGYTDDEIGQTLQRLKIGSERVEDIASFTAQHLAEGKLIGWFQGRMEFGQRALGHRSILADPRRSDAKDMVNRTVKYREDFRPFAPAILKERVYDYFEVTGSPEVDFMEKVYSIRLDRRKELPAVTHVDGTGRLQTVDRETNPEFYALIKAFADRTGVPVILNTSFNLNGEPITCSPEDAIRTFYTSGLDMLVLGHYVIRKCTGEG